MATVSIIVPVYNVAEYLPRCIESIIHQTEESWELILVDDGSSDESGKICDNYAFRDSRIRVIHKSNEGVSIARNLGVSMAKTDKICFIDSDDWVESHYLSDLLFYAKDDSTIVYGNLVHDYENKPSAIGCSYKDGEWCDLDGKNAGHFVSSNRIAGNGYPFAKIFPKKILANGLRFNSSISLHEDHIFVLSCLLKAKRIVLSSTPNYHYVHRPDNNSLSRKRHTAKNMIIASTELIKLVEALIARFSMTDASYIRKLYTMLGLNQLVWAALRADKSELRIVGDAIRSQKQLFLKYYSPNHSYVKLIPCLFFFRLDKLVLWKSQLLGKHI